jgi:hypothetical protein
MRWAITINALHVARDRYRALHGQTGLSVYHLKAAGDDVVKEHLVIWSGEQAAENYELSIPLMSAYGVQDMYGAMEEIIFDLYEVYLNENRHDILKGDEFRDLRRLERESRNDKEVAGAYEKAWQERLDGWRRKKLYSGLHNVFHSFWNRAGLKRPPWYKHTDIGDWCTTIEIFGELRNLITHGEDKASQRLEELVSKQPFLGLTFEAGTELHIKLSDMMIMEHFLVNLLNTINLSLFQRGIGRHLPIPAS